MRPPKPSNTREDEKDDQAPPRRSRFNRGPLRVELGHALQKQRLLRGLTQAQLAEHADLSLKYLGEIERGEANTTLEVIETLADVVGWDPLDAFASLQVREPLTEGVRLLLLRDVQQTAGRMTEMERWLSALDPAVDDATRRAMMREPPPRRLGRRAPRPSRPRKE